MRSRHNTDERSETIDINCIPPETSGCDPVSPKNHFSIGLTCAEQSAKNFCKKLKKIWITNMFSRLIFGIEYFSVKQHQSWHFLKTKKRGGHRTDMAEGFTAKRSRILRSLIDDQSW